MGGLSIWHWLIVLAIVLIFFGGKGRIPGLMKDLGQGVTAFKKGLKDEKPAEGQAANSEDKQGMIDRS